MSSIAGLMIMVVGTRVLERVQAAYPDLEIGMVPHAPEDLSAPRGHPMMRGRYRLTIEGKRCGPVLDLNLAAGLAVLDDPEEEIDRLVGGIIQTIERSPERPEEVSL